MANQQGNGRNSSDESDEEYRERMYRDRERDEQRFMQRDRERDEQRFMQRDRERMGSWDDRSNRSWDRGDDRSVGWRSIDRGGMGQSGYGSGRESGNYLGQGGQQMGNPWGNEMGHAREHDYNRGTYTGAGNQGYGPNYSYGQSGSGYPQYGGGSGYSQYGGGYGMANRGRYFAGNPGYHEGQHGGMGLGQHGNMRHQAYSHLGQPNFGHLGPEYGSHMSGRYDPARDYDNGPEYGEPRMARNWNDYSRDEQRHESLGQRIKHWLQGHRGKGPAGYQRSDERIREHVCETLADDDRVDATFIEVAVKNGEVTLSGTVQDRETKRLAEQCIEDLSGVKDVQNNIRVTPRDQQQTSRGSMTGVGTGSSLETPSGNGTDKRHRA